MIKGHKLEGPGGVIKIMETQHEFKKSKAQYEKQLKDWGFKKNRTKRDWEIMNRKIQLRKRAGKESGVYLDGQLMPLEKLRKETARQGYMTAIEQARVAFEAPPQTPPGFDIRTPLAQPFFRLAFENLAIFQFQKFARPIYAGAIAPFSASMSPFTMMFQSPRRKTDSGILPILDSLLPLSAFLEEPRAAGFAIQRAEDISHDKLLNLATFIASNNFPGVTNGGKLREWLIKTHSTTSVLEALSSMKGPTAEALLENLFRFAIEDEDISTIKYLLQAGVNPNGHKCQDDYDDFTPLQFAIIRGNNEMALELIKAGSTIDEPNTGWKSSALVFAIIGDEIRNNGYSSSDDDRIEECEDGDNKEYDAEDSQYSVDNQAATHKPSDDRLFNLGSSLLRAGAAINISIEFVKAPFEEDFEYDTPLSAASRHRKKDIVDLLIQNGADAVPPTDKWGPFLLHDCIYSRDRMKKYLLSSTIRPLEYQFRVSRDTKGQDAVVGVLSSLIKAGANVHEEFNAESMYGLPPGYSGPESYTIFDLGVLSGSIEVVNILISAGAQITLLSVEYGIQFQSLHVLNHLILAGASVPTIATLPATDHQAHLMETYNIWIKEVALLKAIHLGHVSTIEYLFNDGTFSFDGILLYKSTELTKAIESCCSGGHVRALRFILQHSLVPLSPWFGDSLYLAISKRQDEVIDTLLSAFANVNTMGPEGQTPLFAAIMTRNKKILERLMGMGAKLNPRVPSATSCSGVHDLSGNALIAAIRQGDSDVVKYLLDWGADTEAFGVDHLHDSVHRIERETYGITGLFLLHHPCYCIRPITAALVANNSDLVYDLIRRGVKINNPLDGYSPNTRSRMTPLAAAILIRDPEMVNLIIREGANLDDPMAIKVAIKDQELHWARTILFSHLRDTKSESMLSFALAQTLKLHSSASFDIVRMLLNFGADPNTLLDYGVDLKRRLYTDFWAKESAIDRAAEMNNGLQLLKILLEAGAKADTDVLFGAQYSPVQSAVKRNDKAAARVLLDYGSNPNSVSIGGKYKSDDYRMPLQIAVHNGDVEMIRILLRYKANANGTFIDDEETNSDICVEYHIPRTPLQEASLDGSKEIIDLLLEHGADVNSPPTTGSGATALQYAAMQGFLGIAHLLLEHEADVNAAAAETDGRTALEGAAEHGRLDMVQLLLNAGANVFGDGQAQYENAIRRASGNGHHAIRRMLEKGHSDRE
ncbi:hypothetical protein VE01_03949 [Pseudogymnoascus verrucosus]|uniref:Clr5 domain-containing protein n=1 Tax=Pseudogymnoascus verrucosus TaxID=342668 RepID=A0A1B8GQ48_9PEZI|nr:uncharacterized protein VE01_03949 [Pseudogymnoascus verrucosus]OBT97930.2 hypothetical protein VE01_03949 [Pseudogymnoascus verrucosus]